MSVRDGEKGTTYPEEKMRTVAGLFVAGVTLLVGLKLLGAIVFPLVGLFVGLLVLAVKLAIVVAVGYFVYTLVRGRKHEQEV
jgi:hypothetical protein